MRIAFIFHINSNNKAKLQTETEFQRFLDF